MSTWSGSNGGGGSTPGTTSPSISNFNSWTIYEEFDRGTLGSLTSGHMSSVMELSQAGALTTISSSLSEDPNGVRGHLQFSSTPASTTSGFSRYVMHNGNPSRLASMFDNGFRAEFRFWLSADGVNNLTTPNATFGWMSNSAGTDNQGARNGHAGAMIQGRDLYITRRAKDNSFTRKDFVATLSTDVVYTLSVDTTSGDLVFKLHTGSPGQLVVVNELSIPKWRGWAGNETASQLFGTSAQAADQTVFGVCMGLQGNAVAATRKYLNLDAFFVSCPRVR